MKKVLGLVLVFTFLFAMNISTYAVAVEAKEVDAVGGMREMDSSILTRDQRELVANGAVRRGPAPGLTSIQYLGWFLDDNDDVHIGIQEIGTSSTRVVKRNGIQRPENINEKVILWNSSGIAYGYVRFYNTGINVANWNTSGTSLLDVSYTNAMSPWNILSMSGYVLNY